MGEVSYRTRRSFLATAAVAGAGVIVGATGTTTAGAVSNSSGYIGFSPEELIVLQESIRSGAVVIPGETPESDYTAYRVIGPQPVRKALRLANMAYHTYGGGGLPAGVYLFPNGVQLGKALVYAHDTQNTDF